MPQIKTWLRTLRRSTWAAPFFAPYYRWRVRADLKNHSCPSDQFLESALGLIHVGAHFGEERMDYAKMNLAVLWIEADPRIVPKLRANLRGFSKQICLQALLGDRAQEACDFYIANNEGASSSLYPLDQAHLIWPELKMGEKLSLPKYTLPQALLQAGLSMSDFDTLILDVQGAEMEILKGIPQIQKYFKRIQLETSNFAVYQGVPLKEEIDQYLFERGYEVVGSKIFAAYGKKQCMDSRYILAEP